MGTLVEELLSLLKESSCEHNNARGAISYFIILALG